MFMGKHSNIVTYFVAESSGRQCISPPMCGLKPTHRRGANRRGLDLPPNPFFLGLGLPLLHFLGINRRSK